MLMIRRWFWPALALLLLAVPVLAAGTAEKEKAALLAAEKWLGLVDDEEKVTESWRESADFFRKAVTLQQLQQSMAAIRRPLGAVVARKMKTKTYRTTLPGAPDGEYVVFEFETSFKNKKSATETVTPMLENDGRWRVSGYYIK